MLLVHLLFKCGVFCTVIPRVPGLLLLVVSAQLVQQWDSKCQGMGSSYSVSQTCLVPKKCECGVSVMNILQSKTGQTSDTCVFGVGRQIEP